MNKLVFVASAVSDIQQSDIFMTVKARICEAPAANLNGARVTEAFIDEVIGNETRYVGLPLYADVRSLTKGDYRRLGHLYDSRTGEFHSTQIGSFYKFEKEEFETKVGDETQKGCYLVGYARIAKRNKKLTNAILELFADNALKFSFELTVGEYETLDDDTILIDASESNYLEGTAIVTFPACEDAVALELVAQKADDTEGGEKEMAGIKPEEKPIVAEAEQAEATETVAESEKIETAEEESEKVEIAAEATEETAEKQESAESVQTEEKSEEAECKDEEKKEKSETAEQENAAVLIREHTEQSHTTYAYDTESGVEAMQSVEVETSVSHVEEDAKIVEADDGVHIAEADGDTPGGNNSGESGSDSGSGSNPTPSSDPEPAADDAPVLPAEEEKKTAEQMFAELAEVVESLRKEISELKEMKITASRNVTGEVNSLMDDIHCSGKYSLLEKEEKPTSYTLLSR